MSQIFNIVEELEKERKKNKELEKQLNCKKEFTKYLPKDTEFIILTKPDYDRQQEELQDKVFELEELCNKYEEEHKTTFEQWKKDIKIIDELEKYLKKQMEYYKLDTDYYVEYKLTLDKLNELKGDNK